MNAQTISFADYLADRSAVSKHWLDLIERSPAHLHYMLENPEDKAETPALKFGRIVHSAILEPDTFVEVYAVMPEGLRKPTQAQLKAAKPSDATAKQIAAWEEWTADNAGREIITAEEWDLAQAMRRAVHAHPKAHALLRLGAPEQTTFWEEPNTGERCKARADWLHGTEASVIVDVKTCEDARAVQFAKSIVNYRYDVQAAHYEEGFDLPRFVFIAVEKKPPHGVAVYAVDSEILFRGYAARERNLATYAECKATGIWPGYSQEIETLQLPAWAKEAA